MIILLHSKPRPFPVWVWQARILPVVENQPLYTLVCQLPLLTRGYLPLQTWDLWSRRPDVPISQECSHRPSLLWNGDSLKVPKFGVLRKVASFLKSTHICCVSIVSVWSNECLFSNAQCDLIRLVGAHSKSYMDDWGKTGRWVLFCKWHSFVTVWYSLIDPAN